MSVREKCQEACMNEQVSPGKTQNEQPVYRRWEQVTWEEHRDTV